ncbi:MAG: GntR family transcriptional regulator [Pseudobutyrivibrio sp.]|nr:GntR family transcriptional regulator [Pseudobutyrivibrio sp.]
MSNHKYMDIVEDIKAKIGSGELKPKDKIHSENELSEEYGLSRQTVRHSIAVLEEEGLVRKVKGSGTYVTDNAITDRTNRKTVAVITTYVDAYIFPKMIQYIERVLSDAGYTVQISFTNNRISKEKTILTGIIEKDEVAGVIAEATKSHLPNPNLKYYETLKAMHIPVVFLNSYYEEIKMPHVSINDVLAGKLATEYLIKMGHTKIGGVFKLDDGQGVKRYYGMLQAMEEAGVPITGNDVIWFDTIDMKTRENVEDVFVRIRKRLSSRTALLIYNDETAIKLIELCHKSGIRIPEDLSIVGIDDSVISTDEKSKLTSVIFPIKEVAQKAANNMLELINNPKFNATYEFDLEMVERDSVKRMI